MTPLHNRCVITVATSQTLNRRLRTRGSPGEDVQTPERRYEPSATFLSNELAPALRSNHDLTLPYKLLVKLEKGRLIRVRQGEGGYYPQQLLFSIGSPDLKQWHQDTIGRWRQGSACSSGNKNHDTYGHLSLLKPRKTEIRLHCMWMAVIVLITFWWSAIKSFLQLRLDECPPAVGDHRVSSPI